MHLQVYNLFTPDNPLTALVPDLTDVDPDDAFSIVPYEKGHTFLWYLEELLGGPGKYFMVPFDLSQVRAHKGLFPLVTTAFSSNVALRGHRLGYRLG